MSSNYKVHVTSVYIGDFLMLVCFLYIRFSSFAVSLYCCPILYLVYYSINDNNSVIVYCLCYCISFHHFNVYVENFPSYVVFVCMLISGLRLSDLNKETTYLLTYLLNNSNNKTAF